MVQAPGPEESQSEQSVVKQPTLVLSTTPESFPDRSEHMTDTKTDDNSATEEASSPLPASETKSEDDKQPSAVRASTAPADEEHAAILGGTELVAARGYCIAASLIITRQLVLIYFH